MIYTIRKGDTLSQIAVRFGTTVGWLWSANAKVLTKAQKRYGKYGPDWIYEGTRINVPSSSSGSNPDA